MNRSQLKPLLLICWLAFFLIGLANCRRIDPFVTPTARPPLPTLAPGVTPTTPRLQQYSNPVAFDILYPTNWQNVVVRQGLIVFGTPGATNLTSESVEPSMLVYRQLPNENLNLNEEFERFVELGPLASGFEIVEEQQEMDVAEREGYRLLVRRDKQEELDAARSIIMAAQADNGLNYYFIATAPEAEFDLWRPTFELMFASIEINE